MGRSVFFRFFVIFLLHELVFSICPHEETIERWSDSSFWGNNKPGVNENVTITTSVLLDESPPELFSIIIEKSGRLVWSPNVDIHLRVHYILIRGRMDIGGESADCKYQANTSITLIGERGEYSIQDFDEKFIGVAPNGTLELHGQYKHPWTKLTSTLNKYSPENGMIFRHKDQDREVVKRWISGIQIHVFDRQTGSPINNGLFRLAWRRDTQFETIRDQMLTFLSAIPQGTVVAMAAQKTIVKHDMSAIYDAIEEVVFGPSSTQSSLIRNLDTKGAWALITVRGEPSLTREMLDENVGAADQIAKVELIEMDKKIKYEVSSYIHNARFGRSEVDFIVYDIDHIWPKLDLVDDVSTWQEGDTVLITSTDYNWKQAEKAKIAKCNDCNSHQIRVDLKPKFIHYGEVYKRIDMRAEVALISHNIKIQGQTTDNKKFGGHTKYLHGFKNVHIEGVEFTNMGQQTDLGRYPIHFHMCKDVDTYPDPPYIRQNTIHHTFARCTTIHGTHGLRLTDNVCFDTLGHGYFLEDGGEKRTVFERNLGLGQRRGSLIPVDRIPTTFWITNPQTYLRHNIAAGGDGRGFWFTYPDLPIGPSASEGFMKKFEARHTAIYEFYNNVAHSYMNSGLFIDNILDGNNTAKGYNKYQPWQDPMNKTSGPKEVILDRFTGYKNRQQNVWIRGGLFKLYRFSLSDSKISLNFLRENKQEQYFTESVVVGDSVNLGEPSKFRVNGTLVTYHRSLPGQRWTPRQGIRFFTGPVYISNTWFDGFQDNTEYSAGALTSRSSNVGHSTALNSVSGLKFGFDDGETTGNRVKNLGNIDTLMNDDHIATFRDVDGSLTSVPGSQIVPANDFFMTASCQLRTNWDMAYCPYHYGLLLVQRTNKNEDVMLKRDDDPTLTDVSSDGEDITSKFLTILDSDYSYTLFWKENVPKFFILNGLGITNTETLRVGVCIPRDATFDIRGFNLPTVANRFNKWTNASSLDQVDSDVNGAVFFHDKEVGILFLKLINKNERLETDKNDCPNNMCAKIHIRILSGDLTDGDCTGRAYPKYQRGTEPLPSRRRRSAILTADSIDPPNTWGAGPTLPFVDTNTNFNQIPGTQ